MVTKPIKLIAFMIFLLLTSCSDVSESKSTYINPDSIEVKFEGGAGRVSGSMSILLIDGKQWMVDCGAFYPEIGSTAEERQQKADEKTANISDELIDVDGILLTHAHLDHIGRLPLLVREGYAGLFTQQAPPLPCRRRCLQCKSDMNHLE